MSRRSRFGYSLDTKGIRELPLPEIRAILRGADPLIGSGGRTMLAKILKGSRAKEVLALELDQIPVHGYYHGLAEEDVMARIDWTIVHRYLRIEYNGRLPVLVFTDQGWAIERETYADELLDGFDEKLASGPGPWDMSYLKDRNRALIMLLLDKIADSGNARYIPLLEAWEQVDYKKVRQQIRDVIAVLQRASNV